MPQPVGRCLAQRFGLIGKPLGTHFFISQIKGLLYYAAQLP